MINIILRATTHTLTYVGGYTQSTSSFVNPENIEVDPVMFHCSGNENSLQICANETALGCYHYAIVTVVCVQRNASGMPREA